jgi:hypothetical protein
VPVFVHLTSHRSLPAIRRGGISVYAMPVTRSFSISHQWVRELRRWKPGTIVAVYFRLPSDEPVEVGHYGGEHVAMTAAEAVALMFDAEQRAPAGAREHDREAQKPGSRRRRGGKRARLPTSPEGYEVVIPRGIARSEIIRVRSVPQVAGWRYFPGAHGRAPCSCEFCQRGLRDSRRVRRAGE